MRIAADGYISTLEEANKALAECVNGALEEMERLQKVNKEIARAAEVMAQISKDMDWQVFTTYFLKKDWTNK